MCGINGAFVFKNSKFEISAPYLTKMRDAMSHRGPDGGEIFIAPNSKTGFGHRRLSVIDLSTRANQPMGNDDGSVWLTFNGEIYNHADIRRELNTLRKINWKTDHSDTEVILRAYEQWGIECLHRFRGMFAIGIWDSRTDELWLVRDRLGVKPLYYSIHNERIVFASEIKALLRDPEQKRAVDQESLYHYLSFLTTPAPNTLFEGIKKIPGGCWIKINRAGELTEKRYWDVWDHTTPIENPT
jgi:asparagine synthase (glutamine-hydrolysing)